MLFRNVDLDGEIFDVRINDGRVAEIGKALTAEEFVDAAGGALIRGLTDNHIHLCAFAAARESIRINTLEDITRAHHSAKQGTPIRVVDFHEDVHGPLDREGLDRLAPGRAVRVQHQTGRAWILSSVALREAGIEHSTGVLVGDEGASIPGSFSSPPDIRAASEALAACGVTRITDATPYSSELDASLLIDAVNDGRSLQRVTFTGGPSLAATVPLGVDVGPVKIVVDDHDLPSVEHLVVAITTARQNNRSVAFHCVTTAALALIVVALDEVGPSSSDVHDRIEHGAVIPDQYIEILRNLNCSIVTQPGFIRARGDRYLRTVENHDLQDLYRCGSLMAAGLSVLGSTDAPYGPANPWQVMRSATERVTESGTALGVRERVDSRTALGMFQNSPEHTWRDSATPVVGDQADLVLLSEPLSSALERLDTALIRGTWIGGSPVFSRD